MIWIFVSNWGVNYLQASPLKAAASISFIVEPIAVSMVNYRGLSLCR